MSPLSNGTEKSLQDSIISRISCCRSGFLENGDSLAQFFAILPVSKALAAMMQLLQQRFVQTILIPVIPNAVAIVFSSSSSGTCASASPERGSDGYHSVAGERLSFIPDDAGNAFPPISSRILLYWYISPTLE